MPELYKKFRDSQGLASVSRALQASKATKVFAGFPFTLLRRSASSSAFSDLRACLQGSSKLEGDKLTDIQRRTELRGELVPNRRSFSHTLSTVQHGCYATHALLVVLLF